MINQHSGERLKQIIDERNLLAADVAEMLDISPQALNNWFKRGIAGRHIIRAATTLGLNAEWLSDGREPKDAAIVVVAAPSQSLANAEYLGPIDAWDDNTPLADDEVYVPFLKEVELAAGSGRTAVQQSSDRRLRFGKITLRNQGITPSDAVCVTVSGNSMEPVLPNGSTVGVDRGCIKVIDGKMYALDHNGELRVKTLHRLPGGGIRLRSFNQDDHPDEEYTTEEMAEKNIQILGRVFWSSALW